MDARATAASGAADAAMYEERGRRFPLSPTPPLGWRKYSSKDGGVGSGRVQLAFGWKPIRGCVTAIRYGTGCERNGHKSALLP